MHEYKIEQELQLIQLLCKSDDLHTQAMMHPQQINVYAIAGKEIGHRGGKW